MKLQVIVTLKKDVLDPQGSAIKNSLSKNFEYKGISFNKIKKRVKMTDFKNFILNNEYPSYQWSDDKGKIHFFYIIYTFSHLKRPFYRAKK